MEVPNLEYGAKVRVGYIINRKGLGIITKVKHDLIQSWERKVLCQQVNTTEPSAIDKVTGFVQVK